VVLRGAFWGLVCFGSPMGECGSGSSACHHVDDLCVSLWGVGVGSRRCHRGVTRPSLSSRTTLAGCVGVVYGQLGGLCWAEFRQGSACPGVVG